MVRLACKCACSQSSGRYNADWKSVETANEAFYAKTGGYAASPAALKTAGYLKDEPSTANGYTIAITAGVVTASGACTH